MEIEIQKVPAGNIVGWLKYGWGIFTKSWLMWILALIACFVISIILGFIPLIGQIATTALGAIAGLMGVFMVRSVEQTGSINFGSVIENLKAKSQPLLIFIGIGVAFSVASLGLVSMMAGSGAAVGSMSGDAMEMAGGVMGAMFGGLISIAFGLVYAMGAFFAFPLIAATDISALDAFKASFKATLVNFIACLVYGALLVALAFGCILTLGLGFLILGPVVVGANYKAAKEMFPVIG